MFLFFLTRQQRQEKWPLGFLTPFFISPAPSPPLSLSPSLSPLISPPFYFCRSNMFSAARRADGPTDVTVSCLLRLSRFGPEKRCPLKNRLPSVFFCFFLFFLFIYFLWTLNSHERAIPDDWVTLNSPNFDKKRPDEGKNFIPTSRVPEMLTSFYSGSLARQTNKQIWIRL